MLVIWSAASIEGRLWNSVSGAPVRKADVVVGTAGGVPVKRALSDANGLYRVEGLPAGRYRVAAGRAGFLPALVSAPIHLRADEARLHVDLAMETPAIITGRVLDAENEPVERVTVAAYARKGTGLVRAASCQTNDEGEYRLAGLAAGSYLVRASQSDAGTPGQVYSPVYYPDSQEGSGATPVNVAAGSEVRDLDLHTGKVLSGSLQGVVQGAAAARMPIIRLARSGTDAEMSAVVESENMAAPDGQFGFPKLAPGKYTVSAQVDRPFGWAMQEINVSPGQAAQVTLTLIPGRELSGDSNERVRAVLTRVNGMRAEARTSEAGKLLFSSLTPGTWLLEVTPLSPDHFVSSIRWGDRELVGHVLELTNSIWPRLHVAIGREGASLEGSGSSVSLALEDSGQALKAVESGDGNYRLRGIPPGRYRLNCTGEVLEFLPAAKLKRDCPL